MTERSGFDRASSYFRSRRLKQTESVWLRYKLPEPEEILSLTVIKSAGKYKMPPIKTIPPAAIKALADQWHFIAISLTAHTLKIVCGPAAMSSPLMI
jgi:hypothetical protein